MNKIYVYLMILLYFISIVGAYDSGKIVDLYDINKCEGPINVKITSDNRMTVGEIRIEGLIRDDNVWSGECKDNFKVRFITEENVENKYDITIQYYNDYKIPPKTDDTNRTIPTSIDVFNEQHKIVKRINNVIVGVPEEEKTPFSINIDTKNAIVFGFLIFIFIAIVIYTRVIKPSINIHKNSDVLNYITKEEKKDDELEDMLKILK